MSVATRKAPDWKQWEGNVASGEFPLEQFLGSGGKSAVFRTRVPSGDAAIKLVPVEGDQADVLMAGWNLARALDHPHLIKIITTGTWEHAALSLAYVVMEFADENLGTVLTERALTADETLEMLPPVASALAFLHGRGLVHGHLTPANIFAVRDTLKVSSDCLSQRNASLNASGNTSGNASDDLRGLAATTVQALTQRTVTFANGGSDAELIGGLPKGFQEIVRNCAGQNERAPWSSAELVQRLRSRQNGADPIAVSPARVATPRTKPKLTRYLAIAAGILVVVVTVGGLVRYWAADPISASSPAPKASSPAEKKAEPAAIAAPPPAIPREPVAKVAKPPEPSRTAQSERTVPASDKVTLQVLPTVTEKVRGTVHGKVVILVRVEVNNSGDVTDAVLQSRGSPYLSKLSLEAARKWHFATGDGAASQAWILRFEVTKSDTKVFPHQLVAR